MTSDPAVFTLPTKSQQRLWLKRERIHAALMEEIAQGRLRPGDCLPTEHQLAELLDVSRGTVRQTLSVLEKEGVVRRVRGKGTFVTERPDRSLATNTETLALVLHDSRSGYMPSLQLGFGEGCRRHQRHMLVCDTEQDIYKQCDALVRLIDWQVEGVAIVPPTTAVTPPQHIRPFQNQGIPVVFCHRRVAGVKAPLVTFSGHDVGTLAGRAMGERGHRMVAYFCTYRSELAAQYEIGLRETIQEFGGTLPEQYVDYSTETYEPVAVEDGAEEKLKQILGAPNPPTAILAGFDTTAEKLYLQLIRLGLRVPEDISLVSFGGTWREGAIVSRLTAVTVDEARLGRQAASLLYEMRDGSRQIDDGEEIILPLSLSEGQTLGRKEAEGNR